MAKLYEISPESFIDEAKSLPANGRGAWTRTGIDFNYRYTVALDPTETIGLNCHKSLAHWAVAAGCLAIQDRLVDLKFMDPVPEDEHGIFGKKTLAGVKAFQLKNSDVETQVPLAVDGIVGISDAKALFTPLVVNAERKYSIPGHLLLGETNHESMMDPGAVGYYIYYPGYRGVDRGMSQINSRYNPQVTWLEAFSPMFALDWSAKRLRTNFDDYRTRYSSRTTAVLWDAAICAHNNPSAAAKWAYLGYAPTDAAAKYVNAVKIAAYLKES